VFCFLPSKINFLRCGLVVLNTFSRHIELCCSCGRCGVDSRRHHVPILLKPPKKRLMQNSSNGCTLTVGFNSLQPYTAIEVNREAKVLPVGRVVKVTRGAKSKKILNSPLQNRREHFCPLTIHLTMARVLCFLGISSLQLSHRQMCACELLLSHINYVAKTSLHFIH